MVRKSLSQIVLMSWILAPSLLMAASTYQVQGVSSGDTLNMRSGASVDNPVVKKIPANATQITRTGKSQKRGSTSWVEII